MDQEAYWPDLSLNTKSSAKQLIGQICPLTLKVVLSSHAGIAHDRVSSGIWSGSDASYAVNANRRSTASDGNGSKGRIDSVCDILRHTATTININTRAGTLPAARTRARTRV